MHSVKRITALAASVVALTTLSLRALATANCYPYTPACETDNNCTTSDVILVGYICKQICVPFVDPGCCYFYQEKHHYSSSGFGTCPCDGEWHFLNSWVTHTADKVCKRSNGTTANCSEEAVSGTCVFP